MLAVSCCHSPVWLPRMQAKMILVMGSTWPTPQPQPWDQRGWAANLLRPCRCEPLQHPTGRSEGARRRSSQSCWKSCRRPGPKTAQRSKSCVSFLLLVCSSVVPSSSQHYWTCPCKYRCAFCIACSQTAPISYQRARCYHGFVCVWHAPKLDVHTIM